MDFNIAFNQIIILCIIMLFGFIANKKGIINDTVESSLSTVLLNIALPAMVLASSNIEYSEGVVSNVIELLIVTIVHFAVVIAITTIIAKLLKYEKGIFNVFIALIVFANVGFMGYPVVYAFFGQEGIFYASIVNLVFGVLVWTYGILLFNSKGSINYKKLINMGTISSVGTILLVIFKIKIPTLLISALDITGKMTVPLSMVIIGSMIATVDYRELFSDIKVFIVSILRLLIIPIATAFILKLFNLNQMVLSISILMAAMPSAAINAIFAKQYDSEPIFASVGVFITTILSIVTLPIIVYMMTKFIL